MYTRWENDGIACVNDCMVSQVQHQPHCHQHWLGSLLPCFFSLCALYSWPSEPPSWSFQMIRHVMISPYHVSSLTILHNHVTLQLVGMSITCVILISLLLPPYWLKYQERDGENCPSLVLMDAAYVLEWLKIRYYFIFLYKHSRTLEVETTLYFKILNKLWNILQTIQFLIILLLKLFTNIARIRFI